MIVKRNFNPVKVAGYVWRDVVLAAGVATAVYVIYDRLGLTGVGLSFAPLGVLGTALSIFLAFRASTAFGRWNEAAGIWAGIVGAGRVFGRLIVTFTDSHSHTPLYDASRAEMFKRIMIYRHLAWVNALRLHLRGQTEWETLRPFLSEDEYALVARSANKPVVLQALQGQNIYRAMADGTLQGFDSFQLEGQLAALSGAAAAAERIKRIPIPRQYDYFTRVFVRIFVAIAPFFLIKTLAADGVAWMVVPLSALIAFLFTTIERTAAVNEEPFENRITDVPLSAICRDTERDLRELLGETDLPAAAEPRDGYLW